MGQSGINLTNYRHPASNRTRLPITTNLGRGTAELTSRLVLGQIDLVLGQIDRRFHRTGLNP